MIISQIFCLSGHLCDVSFSVWTQKQMRTQVGGLSESLLQSSLVVGRQMVGDEGCGVRLQSCRAGTYDLNSRHKH